MRPQAEYRVRRMALGVNTLADRRVPESLALFKFAKCQDARAAVKHLI